MENNEIVLDIIEKHHLFILSTDVVGTNVLHSGFKECKDVSNLPSDAEFFFSPDYFPPPVFEDPNFFLKERELIEGGNDVGWNNNALQLDFYWQQSNAKAKYNIGKSLYDFLRPHILLDYFTNIGFIVMVKNPYAMISEILELSPELAGQIDALAKQVLDILIVQRKNNYLIGNNIAFTYEDMHSRPEWVAEKIKEKYGIEDFKIDNKEMPSSDELINKLTDFQIDNINEIFKRGIDTIKYWGYDLVTREE